MSLMDALTNIQGGTAAGAAGGQDASATAGAGAGSSTSKLGSLLAAKAGTAGPASTQENLLESEAGAQTKQQAQLGAANTTQEVQGERTAFGAQQTGQKQAASSEALATSQQQQQFGEQAAATLAALKAGGDQLALQKNQQAAEVLGFQMRLANDKYVTQLNTVATEKRLDDQSQFQTQLYQSELGASLGVLQQRLGSQAVLASTADEFQAQLSNVELGDWLKMAQYTQKSASAASAIGAAGTIVGGSASLATAASKQPTSEGEAETGDAGAPPIDLSQNQSTMNPAQTSATTPGFAAPELQPNQSMATPEQLAAAKAPPTPMFAPTDQNNDQQLVPANVAEGAY